MLTLTSPDDPFNGEDVLGFVGAEVDAIEDVLVERAKLWCGEDEGLDFAFDSEVVVFIKEGATGSHAVYNGVLEMGASTSRSHSSHAKVGGILSFAEQFVESIEQPLIKEFDEAHLFAREVACAVGEEVGGGEIKNLCQAVVWRWNDFLFGEFVRCCHFVATIII